MAATQISALDRGVTSERRYHYAVGYLRAFLVALVVAHHAVLAWHPFAPPPPASLAAEPRWWQAFPVADSVRWPGFAWFVGFNDTFFMSLMFLLSGLFVWSGLRQKGSGRFLADRLRRLGVPFVVATALLAPLAYYPTYLQAGGDGIAGFIRQWFSLGVWPSGPAWFVAVLLAFDCVAAGLFVLAPRWGEVLGRVAGRASHRPVVAFAALVFVSAVLYVPLAMIFQPVHWTTFGPFTFQTSRILHYLFYFLAGAAIGAHGIERGLISADGRLARRWPLWAVGAAVAFLAASVLTVAAIAVQPMPAPLAIAVNFGFVVVCAAASFAFLALFVRFLGSPRRWWDSLAANSYAIYLLHYTFVVWLQYALLPFPWPAVAKGILVTALALALSWAAAAALRRIPAVARVV